MRIHAVWRFWAAPPLLTMRTIFHFSNYQLDTVERRLSRGEEELKLQPKSFDVLQFLLARAGKLVSKDELLDSVWKDAVVTPNSLTRCIKQIRAILNDNADAPIYIETLAGSGYRFIAPVTASQVEEVDAFESQAPGHWNRLFTQRGTYAALVVLAIVLFGLVRIYQREQPAQPFTAIADASVAVLPFENLSPQIEQQYLGDGIADAVIHSLSRIEGLSVTARTSAFSFRGEAVTVPEIGRRLRVTHVLEGSIISEAETIQVSARLIESRNGTEVWSGQFRQQTRDIFAIQDSISRDVAAAMQVNLLGGQQRQASYQPRLEAFEQLILGKAAWETGSFAGYQRAREHYAHAVELDPEYADAKVALARTYRTGINNQDFTVAETLEIRQGLVDAALRLEPTLSSAYVELAYMLRDQLDMAGSIAAFERAIELNENNAEAYAGLGSNLFRTSQFQESLAMHETAVSLAPRDTQYRRFLANAYWTLAQAERAISVIQGSIEEYPEQAQNYLMMVRWLLQLGRGGEALKYQDMARRIDPLNYFLEYGFCDALHHLAADSRARQCLEAYLAAQPNDLNARMTYQIWTEDFAGALRTVEEMADYAAAPPNLENQHLMLLVEMGQWQEALEFALEKFPQLLADPPNINSFTIWPATNIVHLKVQLGLQHEAADLAAAGIELMQTQRRLQGGAHIMGVEDAQFYASLGDRDRMLEILESAVADNWTFYAWSALKSPMFDAYREDAEFLTIRERLKSRLEAELAWFDASQNAASAP